MPLPSPTAVAAPAKDDDSYDAARFTVIRYDAVADDAASGRASDALIGLVASGSAACWARVEPVRVGDYYMEDPLIPCARPSR